MQTIQNMLYNTKLSVIFMLLPACTGATPDFSGYLQKVLKSQTSHACDGDPIAVSCPHKTSISILSAFYGRRISSQYLCPSILGETIEDIYCSAPTALQKICDECQDRRACHFSVNSRIFGSDPCPGTNKYLLVSYKCKPENHRVKTVCENLHLNLTCKSNSLLSIYSASYGRTLQGKLHCDSENKTSPEYECFTQTAFRKVSRRCHRRHNCSIRADTQTFGNPCFPGVMKHLTVSYTCVPRRLLEEVGDSSSDPFSLSDFSHGGWYKGPRRFRLTANMMILNNCLEIFTLTHDVPEKLALYFLCGVSTGLVILLLIFIPKVMLLRDMKKVFFDTQNEDEQVNGDLKMVALRMRQDRNNEDSSSDSSFLQISNNYNYPTSIFSPELTAALECVKEVKGQETDDMWLHKENSLYATKDITETAK